MKLFYRKYVWTFTDAQSIIISKQTASRFFSQSREMCWNHTCTTEIRFKIEYLLKRFLLTNHTGLVVCLMFTNSCKTVSSKILNVTFSPTSFSDCEHLIRRMLVLDPSKRLSVAQIKEHKWMVLDVPVQRPLLYQQSSTAEDDIGLGEYSEQVLRLMHSLGIDQHKTVEVRDMI